MTMLLSMLLALSTSQDSPLPMGSRASAATVYAPWGTTSTRWGDQGNGTYINPVVNADFSDPDVIRVGTTYYMVASDFNYMGIQVLESKDLVNWRLVSQVYDHLEGYDSMDHYAKGSWAPALAFHDGLFYVYFCTPDEGLFMATATDAHGPWTPLHCVRRVKGWEDPCPFWDDDGQAYLGHSLVGAGPIIIHKMSSDGRHLLDEGATVYTGPVAEGTKFLKLQGHYYLVIPEGGVSTGWQTVLRAKSVWGPYQKRIMLEQGLTPINGPHQGNLVSTPDGEWWLLHFQETTDRGRVVHLQPVRWTDGWPSAGADLDLNGIGEPVKVWPKPSIADTTPSPTLHQQLSDEFSGDVLTYKGQRRDGLSLQWQWNHNPVHTHWSLTERKGWLKLCALPADELRHARNTLSQKIMGYKGEAMVQIDGKSLAEGTRAGLCVLGSKYVGVGLTRNGGKLRFYIETAVAPTRRQQHSFHTELLSVAPATAYLKIVANNGMFQLLYSTDGRTFHEAAPAIEVATANWKGPRIGLYCYNTADKGGEAYFNFFRYRADH